MGVSGFEYDPAKNAANRRNHGIDFDDAAKIWLGPVFEFEDTRYDYRERRLIALGSVEARVIVVVYTWRGVNRRLISARKANGHEREIYQEAAAQLPG